MMSGFSLKFLQWSERNGLWGRLLEIRNYASKTEILIVLKFEL